MDHQIRLLICKRRYIYDDIVVSSKILCKYKSNIVSDPNNIENNSTNESTQQIPKSHPILLCKKGLNAYLASAYICTMDRSNIYRKSAVDVLIRFVKSNTTSLKNTINLVIFVRLRTPKYQYIDFSWNERLTQMVMERQEIDHAMSWLSTLGGAFSALGDTYDHCAKVAGKISVEQFKLALRLGDPQLVARCKLYAALSLLQQNYLKAAKYTVKDIYMFAVKDKDVRLRRMCQGVWAKLQYYYSLRKQKIKQLKN